jgi:hypothetical protein
MRLVRCCFGRLIWHSGRFGGGRHGSQHYTFRQRRWQWGIWIAVPPSVLNRIDQRFAIHCCHLCCVPITLARLQQM